MKEATKYANDIAKKENDDALEAVARSPARPQIITLTPQEKAGDEEGAAPGAQGDGDAHRQGD